MGSSLSPFEWSLLAAICGLFYLIFDAARHFVFQLGPVRLRSWSEHPDSTRAGRWSRFDSVEFSLISGAVLQLGLVAALGATAAALWQQGAPRAVLWAMIVWGVIVVIWKFVLAFVPDDSAEKILRAILPLSHVTYFFFWPILAPLARLYSHLSERREEEEDEEEATEEEVQAYIDVGEEEGIFEGGEGRLVQSIVEFGDRLAREVMTPRVDILAFEVRHSLGDLANLFSESKYSRIPIFDQTIDNIVGIVHVKDLLDAFMRDPEKPIRDLARPAYFVPESKLVSELLREFQLEHEQIAMIHDEFGGTAGLITIEDLLEEIVGEIADEHEEVAEESVVEIGAGEYLVNGLLRVEKLEDIFDIDVTGEGYETVGGLIFTSMGRVPTGGEEIRRDGLVFKVERADRKRIYRVRISRDPDYLVDEDADATGGRGNGRYERSRG